MRKNSKIALLNMLFKDCLGSIMDKTLDSGSGDAGSIPVQGTNQSGFVDEGHLQDHFIIEGWET